jgi:putative membrane protein
MKIALPLAIALPAFALLATTPASAAPDRIFLTDAMKGDNGEVALGKMAERQGGSAKVRAYGAMLVTDHGAHKRKVAAVARPLHVPATDALAADGMQAQASLRGLRGPRFDASFKRMMISGHLANIAKYQDQARSGQSPAVRALAQGTLPTLKVHLDHAKAL